MARAESLTIMFVDMAGFAQRTAKQSRAENKAMLRDFNGLLMPLIARFGGRRIKSIGDALLVTFRSPTDSVRCGMAMHDALADYNNRLTPIEQMQIRVALNVGEVRIEKEDIFGEAVNIAARVEELTPPGEIYLTGVVYLSMNKAEVPAEHIGEQILKGIPEPVRLFRVPSRKLGRLQLADTMDLAPGELPYGGMHALPEDSDAIDRLSDALRRLPYTDWSAKLHAVRVRTVLVGSAGLFAAAAAGGGYMAWSRPAPPPPMMPMPVQVAADISQAARDALNLAHTAYFERRRADAAAGYAKVLELEPRLRHDSGLAANLVGTLGHAGDVPVEAIRKYPSPEIIYELSRRTGQPGRIGAQRAAALLEELGQKGRADQRGLAITELNEAPTCEERLAAVRRIRSLKDPRALPVLREIVQRGFRDLFQDKNRCLRDEAERTIADLEKLAPPTSPSS